VSTDAARALAAAVGDGAEVGDAYGLPVVDVPSGAWVEAVTRARDEAGCTFFDWLSAVDEADDGFGVVAHLWSVEQRAHLLLRTRVPRESPRLASVTSVFRGASWHERETFEMFGIVFDGHPKLVPLLLPDGFEGNPLRKDFVLASRAAKPWPGAKEPGESDRSLVAEGEGDRAGQGVGAGRSARRRRRTLPPGVPDPDTWGPRTPG